jgi:hypothetical protein
MRKSPVSLIDYKEHALFDFLITTDDLDRINTTKLTKSFKTSVNERLPIQKAMHSLAITTDSDHEHPRHLCP